MKSFGQYVDLRERSGVALGKDFLAPSYGDQEGEALSKLMMVAKHATRKNPRMMMSALRRFAAQDPEIEAALKEIDEIGLSKLRRAASKGDGLPPGNADQNADVIVPNSTDEPGAAGFE